MSSHLGEVFICNLCVEPFDYKGEAVSHFFDKHTDDPVYPPLHACVTRGRLVRRCTPHGDSGQPESCDCTLRVIEQENCGACGHAEADHSFEFVRLPYRKEDVLNQMSTMCALWNSDESV